MRGEEKNWLLRESEKGYGENPRTLRRNSNRDERMEIGQSEGKNEGYRDRSEEARK
jgi:hypothetical protein